MIEPHPCSFDTAGKQVYKLPDAAPDGVGSRPFGLCAIAPSDRPIRAEPIPVQRASESQPSVPPDPSQGVVYICPMDPDVRSHDAGVCRRCGMTLVAGIPDPVEFHLDLRVIPSTPRPGRAAALQFLVHDPWKNRPVSDFNVVHERFFHTFIVSEDLQFFEHGHPTLVADGVFRYRSHSRSPGCSACSATTTPPVRRPS